MRRTNFRKIGRSEILESISANKSLLFIFGLFILSLFCGAVIIKSANETVSNFVKSILDSYISKRSVNSFFIIGFNSCLSILPYYLSLFILGGSVAGTFLSPIVIILRGLGNGLIMGFLYKIYALQGIAFSALIIVPSALVSALALILCARESFCFSIMFVRAVSPGSGAVNLSNDFRIYCLRYLFLLVILLVSSLLDSILSIAFLRFFTF